jgi:alpha-amylase
MMNRIAKQLTAVTLLLSLLVLAACTTTTTEAPVAQPTMAEATAVAPTPAPEQELEQELELELEEELEEEGVMVGGVRWWDDAIFYEIFVRSFYDSDGDGIGDLNGLIEKLDYLNDGDPTTTDDLGITGIWLMPIMASPSYHGYDVVDYYRVNPDYGTNEDFLRLMEEAHKRGIRVIVDLVLNHTSDEHPWFVESQNPDSPYRDWYVWEETDPGWRGPIGQKVWHTTPTGAYYGIFWHKMPDLNLNNPDVTAAIYDITRFWLEEMQVDGFRLDAIKHLVEDGQIQEHSIPTLEWLRDYYSFVKSVNPETFVVGEVWSENPQISAGYVDEEVDSVFEFKLALDILNSSKVGIGTMFAKTLGDVLRFYPPGHFSTFITNHDQNRVMSQLGGDEGKARVAASLLLTAPGTPFIYYGEEIGMMGVKPDEDIRLPMQWCSDQPHACFTSGTPWRPVARDYPTRSVALQEPDPDSLLNHYRALIQLRNAYPALSVGEWTLVESNPGRVYAALRHTEAQAILVVINVGDRPIEEYRLNLAEGPLTAVSPTLLFGSGSITPPTLNDSGGFADYQPLPELLPHSTTIILLADG